MTPEDFTAQLQQALKSQAQRNLLPFLYQNLPSLRNALQDEAVSSSVQEIMALRIALQEIPGQITSNERFGNANATITTMLSNNNQVQYQQPRSLPSVSDANSPTSNESFVNQNTFLEKVTITFIYFCLLSFFRISL